MPDAETIFAAAAEDIMAALGQAATFTPAVGPSVACRVSVESELDMRPSGYEASAWETGNTIEVLLSDLPAEPAKGSTFLVGQTLYTVKRVLENDGRFVKVAVA